MCVSVCVSVRKGYLQKNEASLWTNMGGLKNECLVVYTKGKE